MSEAIPIKPSYPRERVRNVLTAGRHDASFDEWDERSRRLDEIAASYSRAELLVEPNGGPVTVEEILAWLAGKGLAVPARLKAPIDETERRWIQALSAV